MNSVITNFMCATSIGVHSISVVFQHCVFSGISRILPLNLPVAKVKCDGSIIYGSANTRFVKHR